MKNWIIFTISIIITLTILFLMIFSYYEKAKFCIENGDEYYSEKPVSETGYITCCTTIYKEHLMQEPKCRSIKWK